MSLACWNKTVHFDQGGQFGFGFQLSIRFRLLSNAITLYWKTGNLRIMEQNEMLIPKFDEADRVDEAFSLLCLFIVFTVTLQNFFE